MNLKSGSLGLSHHQLASGFENLLDLQIDIKETSSPYASRKLILHQLTTMRQDEDELIKRKTHGPKNNMSAKFCNELPAFKTRHHVYIDFLQLTTSSAKSLENDSYNRLMVPSQILSI